MGKEKTMIVEEEAEEEAIAQPLLILHLLPHRYSYEDGCSPFTPTFLFSVFTVACGCFTTGCVAGYSSPVEYAIVDELGLSVVEYSVFGSMMVVGGLVSAVIGGKITEFIGRKLTLLGLAGLYIVGWLTIAYAKGAWQLDLGRLLLGMGLALTLYLTPLYVAEISPKHVRGTAVSTTQVTIIVGISFTFLVGSIINWRTMALIGAISGIVQFVLTLFVPESPRWLAKNGKEKQFEAALLRLRGEHANIFWEVDEIKEYTKTIQCISKESSTFDMFQKQYAISLLVGNGLLVLEQFAGMNSYMLYMDAIFVTAGIKNTVGFMAVSSIQVFWIGSLFLVGHFIGSILFLGRANDLLLGTVVTAFLLDRYGRRPLLLASTMGTCCGSFLTALSYILQGFQGWSKATPTLALSSVLIFMGSMALGNGISWTLIAEIFPQNIKGSAGTMCLLSCNISSLLVSLSFQSLLQWSSSGTFLIYACVSAVAIVFVAKLVPETKGRTLEEIQSSFTRIGQKERKKPNDVVS